MPSARWVRVVIRNFKTVEHVELELAPVTVLVGPPASGKSNILEALALLGYYHKLGEQSEYGQHVNVPLLNSIVRIDSAHDLFFFGETQ